MFVASPSDLQEERQAIREVAQEFNQLWADRLGYQVELLGWEDSPPRAGRPQHLINRELDRCVLFIGMLWKRWGTPPSEDGKYTSGFEEEFERSMERNQEHGSPEIALYFKDISDDAQNDPGPDLTRVLKFRQKMDLERKILYKPFSSVAEIRRLARRTITDFVHRVSGQQASTGPREVGATQSNTELTETESDHEVSKGPSVVDDEALAFLEKIIAEFREKGDIGNLEAADVARFRLLGDCVTTSSNDGRNLGAHDTNLLFAAHISGMKFSPREVFCLTRLGFQHMQHENVPLWSWYAMLSDAPYDAALYSSIYGQNDDEKVGAIAVLRALGRSISGEGGSPTKDYVNQKWFSNRSTSEVRSAALGYLKELGTMNDYAVARTEFDRNDIATSRAALECMVGILLKHEQHKVARQLILESQFESLGSDLLNSVLDTFNESDTKVLQLGLEHKNKEVRRRAAKILRKRDFMGIHLAEQLARDRDAIIRQEAILALRSQGKTFSDDEVKEILTKPKNFSSLREAIGSTAQGNRDLEGEALYEQYELERLRRLSESELTRKIEVAWTFEDAPYFARAERYFEKYGDELRSNIDDKFSAYFNTCVDRILATPFGQGNAGKEHIQRIQKLENFHRKELTRRALNILCRAGDAQDLDRVRLHLQTGFTESSTLDTKYLGKHGSWKDIALLAQAKAPISSRSHLEPKGMGEFHEEIVKTVLSLGKKKSISTLLSVELPIELLTSVIKLCSDLRFAKISDKALLELFHNESSDVRKAASIKAVRSLPAKRIKSMLRKYVNKEGNRYYNVIHWLDLGSSMPRDDVRKVAISKVG